jgi:hypothetical protein
MIDVDKRDDDQNTNEKEIHQSFYRQTELQVKSERECSGEQFDQGVAERYGGLTLAALTSEAEVAQQGDVVIEPDGRSTIWTCRPGENYRFLGGYAVYTHIKKTSHAQPENGAHTHQHITHLLNHWFTGAVPLNVIL